MTQIETIIAEIERLMNWKPKAIPSGMRQRDVLNIRKGVLLALKDFINSLPVEQPSEDLEDEIYNYWRNELTTEDIVTISKDDFIFHATHFAQWQKEQDKALIERAEDHAKLAGIALGEKEAKEKFINKACKWLHRCIDVDDEVKMIDGEPEALSFIEKAEHRIEVANQIVKDFKKAMEDEQ